MTKYITIVLLVYIALSGASFNRTSGLVDIPTARILPHFGLRVGLDGTYPLGSADVNEDFEGNFHFSLGLFNKLETYIDVYTIENFTAAFGFCHNFFKTNKFSFAWGVHQISYDLDVSEVGRGDSAGWYDDLMYNSGDYEKPFELGSAFLVANYALHKNVDITIGLGRGRYVGYGTHSRYFNSNFYHEKGGDWGVGLLAGIALKPTDNLSFMIDGDGRDVNLGFVYTYLPIEIAIGLTKVEWYLWSDNGYRPRIAASISYVRGKAVSKPGMIAGKVQDQQGNPLDARVGFSSAAIPEGSTSSGFGTYEFIDVEPGNYEIYAKTSGYKTMKKKVEVVSGKTVTCDFVLEAERVGTGDIAGKTVDLITYEPVGASIILVDTKIKINSDADGSFEFRDLEPGSYHVVAECPGYAPETTAVLVKAGEKTRIEIKMRPAEIPMVKGVKFDFNSAKIRAESYSILDDFARVLAKDPELVVEIQGHADAIGHEVPNMRISIDRAWSVRQYLVNKHGIEPARLMIRGYGEKMPVVPNKTREGRAQNRRVDFVIITE